LAFVGCRTLAGLRWGEVAALEWADIDWRQHVLHVRRTVRDKTAEVIHAESSRESLNKSLAIASAVL